MKFFHAEMAVTLGEHLKGKIDISPYPLHNLLDREQTLWAELLRDPVPKVGSTYTDLDMIVPLHAQIA